MEEKKTQKPKIQIEFKILMNFPKDKPLATLIVALTILLSIGILVPYIPYDQIINHCSPQCIMVAIFLYNLVRSAISVMPTAVVFYKLASDSAEKSISLRASALLSVFPHAIYRLMVTFLWVLPLVSMFDLTSLLYLTALMNISSSFYALFALFIVVIYTTFSCYVNTLWHMACAVSVFEDSYGLRAIKRSWKLLQGNASIGMCVHSVHLFFFWLVILNLHYFVVEQKLLWFNIFYLGILVVLEMVLNLVGVLCQFLLYCHCRSDHNETISWSTLDELLNLGGQQPDDYVPVTSGGVQAEVLDVV